MKNTIVILLAASMLGACGAGVPVTVRIDEFDVELNLDETVGSIEESLVSSGVLPPGVSGIPEVWPASLPDIQYTTTIEAPPVPVDLNPDPGSENAEKYEDINKYSDSIRRIEVNSLVFRYEQNTSTIPFPGLRLQVASDPDADPDDRRAWFTIGDVAPAEPGFVGDLEFSWRRGGETFFNAQLFDEDKDFALRAVGTVDVDTAENPRRPRGLVKLRLIVETTFFIEPENLAGTL
jgi:hypothetical protein